MNTYASAEEMYFTTPDGGERYPMVVPRSAKQIAEDTEFVLYAVVVLKQAVQEFTAKARDKRWTVRATSPPRPASRNPQTLLKLTLTLTLTPNPNPQPPTRTQTRTQPRPRPRPGP